MVDTLIGHIIVALIIWQVVRCYQHWVLAKTSLERLARQGARQGRRKRAKVFKGLTRKPTCEQCEAEGVTQPSSGREPPPRLEPKRGRKRCVPTGHHYCPYEDCRYYGWGWAISAAMAIPMVEVTGSYLAVFVNGTLPKRRAPCSMVSGIDPNRLSKP